MYPRIKCRTKLLLFEAFHELGTILLFYTFPSALNVVIINPGRDDVIIFNLSGTLFSVLVFAIY